MWSNLPAAQLERGTATQSAHSPTCFIAQMPRYDSAKLIERLVEFSRRPSLLSCSGAQRCRERSTAHCLLFFAEIAALLDQLNWHTAFSQHQRCHAAGQTGADHHDWLVFSRHCLERTTRILSALRVAQSDRVNADSALCDFYLYRQTLMHKSEHIECSNQRKQKISFQIALQKRNQRLCAQRASNTNNAHCCSVVRKQFESRSPLRLACFGPDQSRHFQPSKCQLCGALQQRQHDSKGADAKQCIARAGTRKASRGPALSGFKVACSRSSRREKRRHHWRHPTRAVSADRSIRRRSAQGRHNRKCPARTRVEAGLRCLPELRRSSASSATATATRGDGDGGDGGDGGDAHAEKARQAEQRLTKMRNSSWMQRRNCWKRCCSSL